MYASSLVDTLQFDISDLIAPGVRATKCVSTLKIWSISPRLGQALLAESRKSQRRRSNLIEELFAEVIATYQSPAGPVSQKLGFKIHDLVAANQYYFQLDDDLSDYAMSARLYRAIEREAKERRTKTSVIFQELQAELLSITRH
jgi:hypothetical protein